MKKLLSFLFMMLILNNTSYAAPITLTFDTPDTLGQYESDYNLLFETSGIVDGELLPVHTSSTGPIIINFLEDIVGGISFDFNPDGHTTDFRYYYRDDFGVLRTEIYLLGASPMNYTIDFGSETVEKIRFGGQWLQFMAVDNFTFTRDPVPEPGTMALVGIGVIGLALFKKVRRCQEPLS